MSLTANEVISLLEQRYDYSSARTIFRTTCAQAGVNAAGPFDANALEKLIAALLRVGDRVDGVISGLRAASAPKVKPQPAKPAVPKAAAPKAQLEKAAGDQPAKPAAKKPTPKAAPKSTPKKK